MKHLESPPPHPLIKKKKPIVVLIAWTSKLAYLRTIHSSAIRVCRNNVQRGRLIGRVYRWVQRGAGSSSPKDSTLPEIMGPNASVSNDIYMVVVAQNLMADIGRIIPPLVIDSYLVNQSGPRVVYQIILPTYPCYHGDVRKVCSLYTVSWYGPSGWH